MDCSLVPPHCHLPPVFVQHIHHQVLAAGHLHTAAHPIFYNKESRASILECIGYVDNGGVFLVLEIPNEFLSQILIGS